MRFVRTIGLVALVIAPPIAQAAIVTLGFELTPRSLNTASGAHGVTTGMPSETLSDAASFSLTVQLDTDTLNDGGILTTFPSPSMSLQYALSYAFSEQVLMERPAYTDAFNAVVPYEGGVSGGGLVDLARLMDSQGSTTAPDGFLTVNALVQNTVRDSAGHQTQNLRLLHLRLPVHSLNGPQTSMGTVPYLGDDAVAWLQSLQGLTVTDGFRDDLSLVQRRLILDGTTWTADPSNQGILSERTISVTGDVRLRTVTVAVPEPSTFLLSAIGVLGLLTACRRLKVSGA